MAGPGGGPPRRSHTKSRKGCETCKRRHIRCDENFPQCRNCTKHSVRCPYMDMPPLEERGPTPEKADLLWTPEIEAEIEKWQQTGVFPFPQLNIYPAPNPQYFSLEDLRLIHHVARISMELSMQDAGNFTIWTGQIPLFLKIGSVYGFVMHALLALSATHISWLTDDQIVSQMAYEHRGIALKGLQGAIGAFSRENSDAVLAASLLLSWQATDWRGWTQLMQGTSSVIDAMQPWENDSQFGEFIAEQSTFPTAPPSPVPNMRFSQPRKQDLDALQHAFEQLQVVETVLKERREDSQAIVQLMSFIRGIRKVNASHTAAQRFEMLNPLRTWLFWLPVMYLQQQRSGLYSLVVLAYYYTMALVVEPMFPEVGAAYFGSQSITPIEEIARRLFSVNVSQTSRDDLRTPLALMEYPIDMVSKFRARMGFAQPQRTASFPSFQGAAFEQVTFEQHHGRHPLGNSPAFSYSQGHLSPHQAETQSSTSPQALDPFQSTPGHYLELPSSAPFGGYHSPGGSSYGGIAYSDHGDEYSYGPHPSGSMAGYAGTYQPNLKLEGSRHASPRATTPIVPSSSLQPPPQQYQTSQYYSPIPSPRPSLALPASSPRSRPPSPKGKGRQTLQRST